MRPRKFLAVEELQLVGGRLCLDFVNTTGARFTANPRERLNTYRDVLAWSRRVGIISAALERHLNKRATGQLAEAGMALRSMREKRELLYRLLSVAIERKPPPDRLLTKVGRLWREHERRRVLLFDGNTYAFQFRPVDNELDGMIWPIISSTIALLTSPDMARVKRCGECDWLFLDESKNGSRTWCKKECGDRVRARRHYAHARGASRLRAGASRSTRHT